MDMIVHAEGFTMSRALNDAVEEKIGRVEHLAPSAIRARVTLRRVSAHPSPRQYKVHILMEVPGNDLSAEQSGSDPLAAVDLLVEKIDGRLRRRKTTRLARRAKSPRALQKAAARRR